MSVRTYSSFYFRTIRNRTMPVVVDFDQVIAEPQRILDAGWAVPCDVVGLTSKKAKSVRFHPSIGELIHLDQQVATAAVKDALKYLDTLLDHSEWTRHATKSVDSRIGHLEKISHFLRMRQPALSFTSRSLDIMWSLHSESRTCNGKLDKCLTDVLCSLHNHSVATSMVARVQQMSGEGTDGGQCVEVLFEKNELLWPILRLVLGKDSDYLQTGSIRDCWQVLSFSHDILLYTGKIAKLGKIDKSVNTQKSKSLIGAKRMSYSSSACWKTSMNTSTWAEMAKSR
ncbi:hypothetical protein Y032_0044g944 [Ancylostoma ceylanicum]|uniref:Uncharacterized protein n=1 Tax=Ancylostoma ceylanicum TaxID=53326 RepID=A0A016UDW5_9BILA|nr:hypothetical protein Y032_0044g944 [Ancylostoma ceylanicum]